MVHDRRSFLKAGGAAGIATLAGCLGSDGGDGAYPSRTVNVVVPFSSGGGTDTQYRVFQPYFEEELGVETAVDNRSGAGGRTGIDYVYGQEPDGYTVAINDLSSTMMGSELFDPEYTWQELTPLARLSTSYIALIGQPDMFADIEEFRSKVADMDETLTIGTVGAGTVNHLLGITTMAAFGIEDYRSIGYGGGASVANAVANGDVHVGMSNAKSAEGLAADGQVNPLLVLRDGESLVFPEVPTVADMDVDGLEVFGLELGFWGPPELTGEPVSTFVDSVMAAADSEEYAQDAAEQGVVPTPLNQADTEDRLGFFEDLIEEYRELLTDVQ